MVPDAFRRARAAVLHRIANGRAAIVERIEDLAVRWSSRAAGRDRMPNARRRVLFVDDLLPDPMFGAGFPRAHEILCTMVDTGYDVDHYAWESTPADRDRLTAMFADRVRFHPSEGARGLRRLLWKEGAVFDVLFISRPRPMRAFLDARWRPRGVRRSPIVYDAEAVVAPREKRRRELYGPALSERDYRKALSAELSMARGVSAVTAVGPRDAAIVRSVLDVPVFVLPHAETARSGTPGFDARRDVLFVGRLDGSAADSPNVDSVLWFVVEVMPLLDRMMGTDYRLRLVGWLRSRDVEALASDRVVVHGGMEDLRPFYDACRVFVAPTRFAAGIPGKVTEAMSEGVPCVVTPLLAEQLDAGAGACAIAGDAPGFAAACARLYTDAAAWSVIRDGGFAYVARDCSPAAFKRTLADVLERVASAST